MKVKVANAFSAGEHQILWLAGGFAVYRKPGYEEIFNTLDEALNHCPVKLERDEDLFKEWAGGYKLPADEEDRHWPEVFLVPDDAEGR